MRLRIVMCSLLGLVGAATPAQAATVTGTTVLVQPVGRDEPSFDAPAVRVAAAPGDRDDLQIAVEAGMTVVRAADAPLQATGTCTARDASTVECPFDQPYDVTVDLADGDDRLTVTGVPVLVTAGPGDDRVDLRAAGPGTPPREQDTTVHAGPGDDVVLGSAGDDRIDLGAGDDEVHAGAGHDTVATGSGADVLDGGPDDGDRFNRDELTFTQRSRVDVDVGPGRSAAVGGDDRIKDFESITVQRGDLTGTAGDDDLTTYAGAARGRGGDDWVSGFGAARGGPGDDRVLGQGTLTGGPGDDELTAFGRAPSRMDGGPGDDVLEVPGRDVGRARASCGRGRDRLEIPRKRYVVPVDCEAVQSGELLFTRRRIIGTSFRIHISLVDVVHRCHARLRVGRTRHGLVTLLPGGRTFTVPLRGRPRLRMVTGPGCTAGLATRPVRLDFGR